ncbi:MAG: hypothetical protein V2A71_10005, partial [Candidatus Eisenbacteria bacterium]
LLRLVGSILFAACAVALLALPGDLPLGFLLKGIVIVSAAGAVPPPANFTLVDILIKRRRASLGQKVVTLLVDGAAVYVLVAFLDFPGNAVDLPAKVLFAAVVAGVIPGWPDAGKQGALLFKRKQA